MPKLAIRRGDTLDREIELADQDLRIGRGEQNDVVLPDTTKAVSRFHAELRAEGGRYVLLDLNSQNGLWSGGKKHQKITLEPGVPVTIGPYTLTLAGPSPGRSTSETMPGGGTGARPADTLPRGTPRTPAPSPDPLPVRTAPSPKGGATKGSAKPGPTPGPGLIAALARMPKPLLFGGFAVFIILVMALGQLVGPSGSDDTIVTADLPPVVKGPTNEELVRQYLTEAQALFARGDFDGAIQEVDRARAIDPGSVEAGELRARAEEAKAKLVGTGPVEPPIQPPQLPPDPYADTYARARAALDAGSFAEAITLFGDIQRSDPNYRDSGALLAKAREGQRRAQDSRVISDPVDRGGTGRGRGRGDPPPDPHADRYARGRAALDAGSFAEAITLFGDIQRSDPNYRDTGALLLKAREGQRGVAQKALEDGTRLENAGDWVASVQQYERAKALDPSFAGVADESARRVRGRMSTEGADAYKRARQADAVGRTADAIALYDRAARFLADEDPNKKIARDRLDVLRAKR